MEFQTMITPFKHCQITLEDVNMTGAVLNSITKLGFKINKIDPLVVENDSPALSQIESLHSLIYSKIISSKNEELNEPRQVYHATQAQVCECVTPSTKDKKEKSSMEEAKEDKGIIVSTINGKLFLNDDLEVEHTVPAHEQIKLDRTQCDTHVSITSETENSKIYEQDSKKITSIEINSLSAEFDDSQSVFVTKLPFDSFLKADDRAENQDGRNTVAEKQAKNREREISVMTSQQTSETAKTETEQEKELTGMIPESEGDKYAGTLCPNGESKRSSFQQDLAQASSKSLLVTSGRNAPPSTKIKQNGSKNKMLPSVVKQESEREISVMMSQQTSETAKTETEQEKELTGMIPESEGDKYAGTLCPNGESKRSSFQQDLAQASSKSLLVASGRNAPPSTKIKQNGSKNKMLPSVVKQESVVKSTSDVYGIKSTNSQHGKETGTIYYNSTNRDCVSTSLPSFQKSDFKSRNHDSNQTVKTKQSDHQLQQAAGNYFSGYYYFGKIGLTVAHGYAMNYNADVVICVGDVFVDLVDLSQRSIQKGLVPDRSNAGLKGVYSSWCLFGPDSSNFPVVCSLSLNPNDPTDFKYVLDSLPKALRDIAAKNKDSELKTALVTNSILYPDPLQKISQSGGAKSVNHASKRQALKVTASFVKMVAQFLQLESSRKDTGLEHVTLLCSEDFLPAVIKPLDALAITEKDIFKHEQTKQKKDQPEEADDSETQAKEQDVTESFSASVDDDYICIICERPCSDKMIQDCCGGIMCKACQQYLRACPFCLNAKAGLLLGNQPKGKMHCASSYESLPGFENNGSYTITYSFEDGIQSDSHPHPGRPYKGTERKAFLPATELGIDILYMLRVAFLRGLTFTIGQSLTTMKEDVVVWTGIEHKTRKHGGKEFYGYPDKDYLLTVVVQLKQMGVTLESITEVERESMRKYFAELEEKKYVYDDDRNFI